MGNIMAGLTLVIVFIIACVLVLKSAIDLMWDKLSTKQRVYKVFQIILGLLILYGMAYMFDNCTV